MPGAMSSTRTRRRGACHRTAALFGFAAPPDVSSTPAQQGRRHLSHVPPRSGPRAACKSLARPTTGSDMSFILIVCGTCRNLQDPGLVRVWPFSWPKRQPRHQTPANSASPSFHGRRFHRFSLASLASTPSLRSPARHLGARRRSMTR